MALGGFDCLREAGVAAGLGGRWVPPACLNAEPPAQTSFRSLPNRHTSPTLWACSNCVKYSTVCRRLDDAQRDLIGAPGFEPGTSPTRTVRATRLRHAPRGVDYP